MSQILIVEDEPIIRSALRKLLERNEHQVTEAASVEEAKSQAFDQFDLVISDLRLPGSPGSDLVQLAAPTPVLIMTSYASLKSAVDIMRDGAVDYIPKPFDHDEMVSTVKRILTEKRAIRPAAAPQSSSTPRHESTSDEINYNFGDSENIKIIVEQAKRVAKTDISVLIQGEPSTGKQHLAKYIHQQSQRDQSRLLILNCATLPSQEQELEMFGGETTQGDVHEGHILAADGGTLLLAEVETLSDTAQVRLLRLLETNTITPVGGQENQTVDIRVIATSNIDLAKAVQRNEFRQDLFYRLNIVPLQMPPLRERISDVQLFAQEFLQQITKKHGTEAKTLRADAEKALKEYHWPGNLQELENTIERAVILCDKAEIDADSLSLPTKSPADKAKGSATQASRNEPMQEMSLEDYFTRFVLENQDSMTETELAQKLGISRKNLWERRQRLGIPRTRNN